MCCILLVMKIYQIPGWVKILDHILVNKKSKVTAMSKDIGMTWSNTVNIVSELHSLYLINKTKTDGRTKSISLTKKGRELAVVCNKLISKHKEYVINGEKGSHK